jgi:hypothetical protein
VDRAAEDDQQAAVRALEHIRSLYPQYAKRCTELIQMREEFERRSDEEKARKGDL